MDHRMWETAGDAARGRRKPAQALNGQSQVTETAPAPAPLAQAANRGSVLGLERWLLGRLLQALGNPPLSVVLWNGERFSATAAPIAHIRIGDRRTLWKLFLHPSLCFGDAYSAGQLEVEGNLVELLTAIYRSLDSPRAGSFPMRLAHLWYRRRGNTLRQSRNNIRRHYDLGNDFYQLWLDERLVYTCGYFAEPSMDLERAQLAKMDHVCRKLWLQPGETVMEAGCGWGSLALHMARHYGVRVRAFNISHEQISYARQRAQKEGLAGQVEFVEDDWRNMQGPGDAFVSVGMLEHVGRKNYRLLGAVVRRCLKPPGRGLIHSIGRNRPSPTDAWTERRIFPGAYPPALGEIIQIFEPQDFSILDVENLRLHYAETLRHWLERFEASVAAVQTMFDPRFVRMWRLYLSGSLAAFQAGELQLFQILFAGRANHHLPRSRRHLYGPWPAADGIRFFDDPATSSYMP